MDICDKKLVLVLRHTLEDMDTPLHCTFSTIHLKYIFYDFFCFADLVPFQVLVQNENRGRNKRVSYTKSVSITVYNYTISMSSDNPGKVLVNI